MKALNYEKLISISLLTAAIGILVLRIILCLSYLPEIGGGMSINMLYGIRLLSFTGNLYLNPEEPPFTIIQYTPLYYYFISGISKLLNPQNDLHSLMILHRFVCLFANIAYCFLTAFTIKKLFANVSTNYLVFAASVLFIITPCLSFERLDNIYLLFIVSCIYFFCSFLQRFYNSHEAVVKSLVLSGIFCSLALLTKQTAIWTLGLIPIWLLLVMKSPKLTFVFLLSTLLPFFAGVLFSTQSLIDFKLNTVDGLKNGINLGWFYNIFIKGYFIRFAILIVVGIHVALILLKPKRSSLRSFIGFSILYFFIAAFAFSFKYGATQNYYIEFTIMFLIGIAILLNEKINFSNQLLRVSVLYVPFFLLTCVNDKGWKNLAAMKKAKKDFIDCARVSNYLSDNLSKENYFFSTSHTENCLNLMLPQQTLFPCREVAFKQTYPLGVFKFEALGDLIQNNKLQFIVSKKDLPSKILYASPVNFEADTIIGDYTIYKSVTN